MTVGAAKTREVKKRTTKTPCIMKAQNEENRKTSGQADRSSIYLISVARPRSPPRVVPTRQRNGRGTTI
jgi:hypothetical protein